MAFTPIHKKWLNLLLLVISFLVGWLLGDIPIIQDNKILIITALLILLVIFNIREKHPIKQKAKQAAATASETTPAPTTAKKDSAER